MMHLKLIACKIVERELAQISCTCKNVIDTTMIRMMIHIRPKELNLVLQEEIEAFEADTHRHSNRLTDYDYDAILIGYGLCANATTGLHSSKFPLVIPKAHDCVTFIMGSKEAYRDYYAQNPGTFYYWPGAVELMAFQDSDRYNRQYEFYLERYKGNARKAKKAADIEMTFLDTYKQATYLRWPSLPFPEYEQQINDYPTERGWDFETREGNDSLLRRMLDGQWDKKDFLVVPPGYTSVPSYDENVIKAVPYEEYLESLKDKELEIWVRE